MTMQRAPQVRRLFSASAVSLLLLCLLAASSNAELTNTPGLVSAPPDSLISAMEYRSIGPYRGGRSAAAVGIPGRPMEYLFGATGGGVWKTKDGGNSWFNISDGYFGSSIGAVAVSEWDPNVIYVGEGEKTVRGNVSFGNGMWKSEDGGQSWRHIGLSDSQRIPRVRIHPKNPDLVYAAVLGHLSGPNEERGVFRSKDGGENWEKVLFVNNEVGAVDLIMDPNNPRILYAGTWRIKRTPYSLESGGEGSGLWKSTDGGDTWKDITRSPGLPKGLVGIVGVTVSPANSNRVWANIEAEDGGVFRSENGGKTWTRVSEDRNLRQRAWYYTRIYADSQDEDVVYVLNVQFWRSKDGGETYESIQTPHGDHHDLWINPDDPDNMVIADDGGAQVTFDGGENFTTYMNQPTAQFYRVTTDNAFPYNILGAQQDNSTVRIPSRTSGSGIRESDWEPTAGGESGWLAPHPDNPDIVYGGSYGGFLQREDHSTGISRLVNVWPDNPMGHGVKDWKYRFQWNFPIVFSKHDSGILYTGAQVLFKTTNEGQTWIPMSPDLTRNDSTTMESSGGPITKDNTGVEYYGTIFSFAESNFDANIIWTGSDDGLIHVTQDGGENWTNVTPSLSMMPEWAQVNSIEAHPTETCGAYVASTRYKSDDFTPYLYKTTDCGANWDLITDGIPENHFTRVVRADPDRAGLLYAGTEFGMYISFDDGANWQSFQNNLPMVPITDLALKDKDLVVATQGRSFWVMDDLTPLHEMTDEIAESDLHVFQPRTTYLFGGGGRFGGGGGVAVGSNPPSGAVFNYLLKTAPSKDAPLTIEFRNSAGDLIRTYDSSAKERNEKITAKAGMNQFVWNLRYPDAAGFDGLIMWAGSLTGPRAVPGMYQATLTHGDHSQTVQFEVKADPRAPATQADYVAQFDYLMEVRDKVTETHEAIKRIRAVRAQLTSVKERVEGHEAEEAITESADSIDMDMTEVEEALYQTKNQSRQDPLNFPIRLNNKLAALNRIAGSGPYKPTDGAAAVKAELVEAIDAELDKLKRILDESLPQFNTLVRQSNIPAIMPAKVPLVDS